VNPVKKVLKDEKGAVMVEMAFSSVILIGMIAILITGGLAMYNWIFIQDAARDGARHQALGLGSASVKAEQIMDGHVVGTTLPIQVIDSGDYIEVIIDHESPNFAPGIGLFFPDRSMWKLSLPLRAKAVFKKEY
jgi:Flp pilus assembly pilin Flp